jgi:hypothetical protein
MELSFPTVQLDRSGGVPFCSIDDMIRQLASHVKALSISCPNVERSTMME